MIASRMVGRRQETLTGFVGSIKRPLAILAGLGLVCGAASSVRAQCGFGGDFSGQCVDLRMVPSATSVQVGEIFSVELFMKSVNDFDQPIFAVEGVLDWDPTLVRLVGNEHDCTADNTAVPCFTCGQTVGGGPTGYNWLASGFPDDSGLDGLNADCGPGTFCSPFTGTPFNDGTAFYQSFKQIFCNGGQAPAPVAPRLDPAKGSLLVTRFLFEALAAGPAQISLLPDAACQTRQKICLRGDAATLENPCSVDSDCGVRVCVGGLNDTLPCAGAADCSGGTCPPLCTACGDASCCTGPGDNCTLCSFAETRVVSSIPTALVVTASLPAPVVVSVIDCPVPSVTVDSSRYLNVTPPANANAVAIEIQGVSTNVACVSRFVQSDGQLGVTPVYMTPAQWQSAMTDALNDPTDPTVHVRGDELVAGETYSARLDCNPASPGTSISPAVNGTLWLFGDTDNNADRNITDVVRILSGFSGVFHTLFCTSDADCSAVDPFFHCDLDVGQCLWLTRENVDIIGIQSCGSDRDISIRDALSSLDAFQGLANPCTIFCP